MDDAASAVRAVPASATSRCTVPLPPEVTAHMPSMFIPACPNASPSRENSPGLCPILIVILVTLLVSIAPSMYITYNLFTTLP